MQHSGATEKKKDEMTPTTERTKRVRKQKKKRQEERGGREKHAQEDLHDEIPATNEKREFIWFMNGTIN